MVAEGNADQDLTEIAHRTGARFRYFDTKTPDFLGQIRKALQTGTTSQESAQLQLTDTIIKQTRIVDSKLADAEKNDDLKRQHELRQERLELDQQLEAIRRSLADKDAMFEKRLAELELRRQKDYDDLYQRAKKPTEEPASNPIAVPTGVPSQDPLETTYSEISAEYLPARAIRVVMGRLDFILFTLILCASIAVLFAASDIFSPPDPELSKYPGFYSAVQRAAYLRLALRKIAFVACVGGVFGVVRSIINAQRFYEHARRLLREVYIRTRNPEDLTKVDTLLQEVLATYGPVQGVLRARETLAKKIDIFGTASPQASSN